MTPAERLGAGFDQIVARITLGIDIAMAVLVAVLLLVLTLHAVDSGRMRWPWFERAVLARARRLRPAHERYRDIAAAALADEVAALRTPGGWLIADAAAERAAWASPILAPRLVRQGTHALLRFVDEEVQAIAAELRAGGLRLALAHAPPRDRWSFPNAAAEPAEGARTSPALPKLEEPTP